jgi:steroid 5-alpha reductase family enzyme
VNYRPMKGRHPNWFHRQMFWLLLGVRWVKDAESERK